MLTLKTKLCLNHLLKVKDVNAYGITEPYEQKYMNVLNKTLVLFLL